VIFNVDQMWNKNDSNIPKHFYRNYIRGFRIAFTVSYIHSVCGDSLSYDCNHTKYSKSPKIAILGSRNNALCDCLIFLPNGHACCTQSLCFSSRLSLLSSSCQFIINTMWTQSFLHNSNVYRIKDILISSIRYHARINIFIL